MQTFWLQQKQIKDEYIHLVWAKKMSFGVDLCLDYSLDEILQEG